MTISVHAAAKKICDLSNWTITNLELHKILYISQCVYMGRNNGNSLIDEEFEAWDYGPVLPNLYHEAKIFGSKPVKNIFLYADYKENDEEIEFLTEAYENLKEQSPAELVANTHRDDGAWARHYQPGVKGIKIPNESIIFEYEQRSKKI